MMGLDNYERRRMVIDQIIRDIENGIYKKLKVVKKITTFILYIINFLLAT